MGARTARVALLSLRTYRVVLFNDANSDARRSGVEAVKLCRVRRRPASDLHLHDRSFKKWL